MSEQATRTLDQDIAAKLASDAIRISMVRLDLDKYDEAQRIAILRAMGKIADGLRAELPWFLT